MRPSLHCSKPRFYACLLIVWISRPAPLTVSLLSLLSHVLWAPNTASAATFPGLANACARAQEANSGSEAWAEVQRQLSIVVTALEGAAATLKPVEDL